MRPPQSVGLRVPGRRRAGARAGFPQQAPLEIDGEHQQRIGEYLRLRTWDTAAGERLARFLEDEALRLERTASLLARARALMR